MYVFYSGTTTSTTTATLTDKSDKHTSSSSSTSTTAKTATSTTTTTTSTSASKTEATDIDDLSETTLDWRENVKTTAKPKPAASGGMDIFGIAKRIAEIKLRLGLTILKHASENFARYIGHIQKRFNGEE